MKNQKSNSIFKIKADHQDLTITITIMCLERSLKRIKAQLKHSIKNSEEVYCGIDNNIKDYKTIKKAIKIIESYK